MHGITAATGTAGTASATGPQPRLVRAAHEFEAQMMKELMKPLNQGNSSDGSDEDGNETPAPAGRWASSPPRRWAGP